MTAKKDMVRTSVYLDKKNVDELRKQSQESGVSLTYMINKALKTYLEEKK